MKKAPVSEVFIILKKEHPNPGIALNFSGVWQLLVAVVLSAQCTDVRVNIVTPPLFNRFPGVKDFAECKVEDLEKMIYSTGFYRSKAKSIKAAAQRVMNEYGGKVPDEMEDLLTLGGVARKTANVVLAAGFGKSVGVTVDTHVARICGKLGWVSKKVSKAKNAIKIEQTLMKIIPKKEWMVVPHLLILHGRKTCVARKPKCTECPLKDICPGREL